MDEELYTVKPSTFTKMMRVGKHLQNGVITLEEFNGYMLELLVEDRNEILEAERNGTLIELYPNDM